ncbi:hypothetical protein ACFYKX_14315 [Cytobacillus sp. FJAT-54145]|uniref:SbsC C-terminal domain-containing protein n=1 Tax=Cytobacillus spartinae TaxID=3299023 RepID=A0ABW6KC05_9BACI
MKRNLKRKKVVVRKIIAAGSMALTSVFVATNPANASAEKGVEDLVLKAEKLAGALKWEVSYEHRKNAYPNNVLDYPNMKLFNETKKALSAASDAVSKVKGKEKDILQARLEQNVQLYFDRAVTYIDAVSAGKKILKRSNQLETLINEDKVDETTVATYHELTKEIKRYSPMFYRVFGKTTREAFLQEYQQKAYDIKEKALYPVSIKMELDRLSNSINDENVNDVIYHYDRLVKLFEDGEKTGNLEQNPKLLSALEKLRADIKAELDKVVTIFEADSLKKSNPTIIGQSITTEYRNTVVIIAGQDEHIKLQNVTILGNLVIKGDNTGAGSVYLENVKVNKDKDQGGSIIVENVANHSLYQKNVVAENLTVNDTDGANIVAEEGTQIKSLVVSEKAGSSGTLNLESKQKGAYQEVELASKGTIDSKGIELKGDFSDSKVSVTGEGSQIKIAKDTKVKEIDVKTASSLSAEKGAEIKSVNIAAKEKGQTIKLEGDLKNTVVNISNANAEIKVAENTEVKEVKKDSSVKEEVKIENNGKIETSSGVEVSKNPPAQTAPSTQTPTTPAPPSSNDDPTPPQNDTPTPPSDRTAPTVTLNNISSEPVEIGSNVNVTSNENGTVYLVPSNTNKSVGDLNSAAEGENGVKISVTANQSVDLDTTGFAIGEYVVYAVDSANNISSASSLFMLFEPTSLFFQSDSEFVIGINVSTSIVTVAENTTIQQAIAAISSPFEATFSFQQYDGANWVDQDNSSSTLLKQTNIDPTDGDHQLLVTSADNKSTQVYKIVVIANEIVEEVNLFKTTHATAISLNDDTVAISDKGIIETALNAYTVLSDEVKERLSTEKSLLEGLLAKVEVLELEEQITEFKSTHAAALELTENSVGIVDKGLIDTALTAYQDLSDEAKAGLLTEKSLLDSLKAKIVDLELTAQQIVAFRTTHAEALALTVDAVVVSNKGKVTTALTAFEELSEGAKQGLGTEKILLDKLLTKIVELESSQPEPVIDYQPNYMAGFTANKNQLTLTVTGKINSPIDVQKLKYSTSKGGENFYQLRGEYTKVSFTPALQPGQYYYSDSGTMTTIYLKLTDEDANAIKSLTGYGNDSTRINDNHDRLIAEDGWCSNASTGMKSVSISNQIEVINNSGNTLSSKHTFRNNEEISSSGSLVAPGTTDRIIVNSQATKIVFYVGDYVPNVTPTTGKMKIVYVDENTINGITLDDTNWITVDESNFGLDQQEMVVKLANGSLGTASDKKITGLTSGKKYMVMLEGKEYGVQSDGTLVQNSPAQSLEGTEITGLTNGETYEVLEVKTPSTDVPRPNPEDFEVVYAVHPESGEEGYYVRNKNELTLSKDYSLFVHYGDTPNIEDIPQDYMIIDNKLMASGYTVPLPLVEGYLEEGFLLANPPTQKGKYIFYRLVEGVHDSNLLPIDIKFSEWVADGQVTGGPTTLATYVENGLVVITDESQVTHDAESDNFIIPEGVTSFKFTDNGIEMLAEYKNNAWIYSRLESTPTEPIENITFKPNYLLTFTENQNKFNFVVNGSLTGEINLNKFIYSTSESGGDFYQLKGEYTKLDSPGNLEPGQYYYSQGETGSDTHVFIKLADIDANAIKNLTGYGNDSSTINSNYDRLIADTGWYGNGSPGQILVSLGNQIQINNISSYDIASSHIFDDAEREIGTSGFSIPANTNTHKIQVSNQATKVVFYVGDFTPGEKPTTGKMKIVYVDENTINGITLDDTNWITVDESNFGLDQQKMVVKLVSGSIGIAGDKKISGLTSGKKYMVILEGREYGVQSNGILVQGSPAEPIEGAEITGLSNGKTYEVLEVKTPSVDVPVPSPEDFEVVYAVHPDTGSEGYWVKTNNEVNLPQSLSLFVYYGDTPNVEDIPQDYRIFEGKLNARGSTVPLSVIDGAIPGGILWANPPTQRGKYIFYRFVEGRHFSNLIPVDTNFSEWISDGQVTGGPTTAATYVETGLVEVTDDSGVTHNAELDKFIVPGGVSTFRFTDDSTEMLASYEDDTWTFSTLSNTVIPAADTINVNTNFSVINGVEIFIIE